MRLTPRYGADPLVTLDGDPAAIAEPTIRQRRRLVEALASFTDEQWAQQSRCAGWASRDVVVHLDSTNFFWTQSIAAGLRGEPTRFLATFDPVASPAQSVAQLHDLTTDDVLARFSESTDTLAHLLDSLDTSDWVAIAEAPPGHLTVSAVTHHALWDSWIHERDILLPLQAEPSIEPDEVTASLRYAAALGPALAVTRGNSETGRLGIHATKPDMAIVVDVGEHVAVSDSDDVADLTLTGDAVELVDALSIRRPLDQAVPADQAWMLNGLLETFDNATP